MVKKRCTRGTEITSLLFMMLLILIPFVYAQDITAGGVTSEGITTVVEDLDSIFVFDSIEKIYDVSTSRLETGYSVTLNEKDAFRIEIKDRIYYIVLWNISEENVRVIFPKERQLIIGVSDRVLVDVNKDSELDIQLELKSIEDFYDEGKFEASVELGDETSVIEDARGVSIKKATLFIKTFVESELLPSGDYFELFDVTVRLVQEELFTSRDLAAFIIFENFGEGVSQVEIVYSIIDEKGEEVYRGVDSIVVQTEERVTKDFNFLELPLGTYILRTEIFYGDNQTGESEQDFEIVEVPFFSIWAWPLVSILSIVILFITVKYIRKSSKVENVKAN